MLSVVVNVTLLILMVRAAELSVARVTQATGELEELILQWTKPQHFTTVVGLLKSEAA